MYRNNIVCRACKVIHRTIDPEARRADNRQRIARGFACDSYPESNPKLDAWNLPRVSLTARLRQEVM